MEVKRPAKLDSLDKNILYILDTNSRTPSAKIARMLKTSKERVIYRINKLVEAGVISKFLLVTDLAALGHSSYKVYLQFQKASGKDEEEIVNYLISSPRTGFIARCEGKYDLLFAFLVKGPEDFNALLEGFLGKYSSKIKSYDVEVTLSGETFSRKYLIGNERPDFTVATWGKGKVARELDETDMRILGLLGKDCRKSALELAKEAGISGDTVLKRMKGLEKSGIIQAYKTQLNKRRFGYSYYKLFLNLAFLDEKAEKRVMGHFRENPYVVFAMKNLGKWNYELDVEMPADEPFYAFVRKMRDSLGELLLNYESLHCYEEPKFNYMEIDTESVLNKRG